MGRKKLVNKLNKTLQIRLKETDKDKLESVAKTYNYSSISKFIRNIPKIINQTKMNAVVRDDLQDIKTAIDTYFPDEFENIVAVIEDKLNKWDN